MTSDSYELSKELDYLFASYLFCNKPQMRRLLSYLVQHCFDEGEAAFDQRAIAIECLGRKDDFDPAENPVVRIEVGRLRRLLNSFYEEELERNISITIPLGQYRPKIVTQAVSSERGFLPKLAVTPAKPECLSLLLQFNTEGEESSELYLLRHQVRIGLTIDLGKIFGVRLVVALPDEDGQVADSIDFVMRVTVSARGDSFYLASKICLVDTTKELFGQGEALPKDYDTDLIKQLLHYWVTDFFDPQIGLLWPRWIKLRESEANEQGSPVKALVNYRRYQLNETKENLQKAMQATQAAVSRYPGDQLVSFTLADLYYGDLIHGFQVSADPLTYGIRHVREAIRFNPGCSRLHTLLALLTFFSREYDIASMELGIIKETEATGYSFLFQRFVLQCLMGDWQNAFKGAVALVEKFQRYPSIYPVLAYINAWLSQDMILANEWREEIMVKNKEASVLQCIRFMALQESGMSSESSRNELITEVSEHLFLV